MPAATKDTVLASVVDQARDAAVEVAGDPGLVGEHQGVVVEGERLIAHRFVCLSPGYRGWSWTVTVTRVPRSRKATVCEVDLLPGDDAVLAPAWVPWSERIRPGDLGPGDVLPFQPDDDRLEPGYEATGDVDADQVALFELGLGRERVLSRQGRAEAAQRWYTGTRGPTAPQAVAASAPCSTCGFLVLMAGSLRTEFGVCANEWSPDDGRVVSMDHGCGAHSQTDVEPLPSDWPDQEPFADDALEIVPRDGSDAEPEAAEALPEAEADPEVDPEQAEPSPEPDPEQAEPSPEPDPEAAAPEAQAPDAEGPADADAEPADAESADAESADAEPADGEPVPGEE